MTRLLPVRIYAHRRPCICMGIWLETFCLPTPCLGCLQVQEAARQMAARMAQEPSGTQAAVDSFHRYVLQTAPCYTIQHA